VFRSILTPLGRILANALLPFMVVATACLILAVFIQCAGDDQPIPIGATYVDLSWVWLEATDQLG